jgi:adenylate kinase family enzyme
MQETGGSNFNSKGRWKEKMGSSIVLIGPLCAGKSTVGRLLAEKLRLPQISMDAMPLEFFTDLGFDPRRAQRLRDTEGWLATLLYMQEFSVPALERILRENRRHVIDLGAPYSTYRDESLLERAKRALSPYPHVVLLLPSKDLDESTRILKERMSRREGHAELRSLLRGVRTETGIDYEELYVKHHSNFELARITVYTNDKTPEQTRDEIIERLDLSGRKAEPAGEPLDGRTGDER